PPLALVWVGSCFFLNRQFFSKMLDYIQYTKKRFNCLAEVQIGTSWRGFRPCGAELIAEGTDRAGILMCNRERR
ncbi:hypothetical protein ACFXA3_25980, partial [Streptomyces sp. NPDC059456]|uniref:hypothetical protein n=1 Tax=Streptomyces sp. NPDC059456 TaxID=3346838 RepID=UPI0036C5B0E5